MLLSWWNNTVDCLLFGSNNRSMWLVFVAETRCPLIMSISTQAKKMYKKAGWVFLCHFLAKCEKLPHTPICLASAFTTTPLAITITGEQFQLSPGQIEEGCPRARVLPESVRARYGHAIHKIKTRPPTPTPWWQKDLKKLKSHSSFSQQFKGQL